MKSDGGFWINEMKVGATECVADKERDIEERGEERLGLYVSREKGTVETWAGL